MNHIKWFMLLAAPLTITFLAISVLISETVLSSTPQLPDHTGGFFFFAN